MLSLAHTKYNIFCKPHNIFLQVKYFIGRKAIDAIMESKLKDKLEIHTRQQACYLMEEMLAFKFFHRASKVAMEVKPKKSKVRRETCFYTSFGSTLVLSSVIFEMLCFQCNPGSIAFK